MKYNQPFISVVTPSLNQGRFLKKNIENIRSQESDSVEHIIIDGGSTDETLDMLQSCRHAIWVSEQDRGQAEALNKGISMARGEWIVWINSDDFLLPGALQKFIDYIDTKPDARFVYSNCTFVDENNTVLGQRKAQYRPDTFYYWWKPHGAGFAQPGTFFRKSLWEQYGPFDETLHYMMDYDFWLRIHENVRFDYLDDCLAAYRVHGDAKTALGWRPFVEEGITVSRRFWQNRKGIQKTQVKMQLAYMYAQQLMTEGMRCRRRGDKVQARQLWSKALATNPVVFLSFTHMRFRLWQFLGDSRYHALSNKIPGLKKLENVFEEREYHRL